MKTIILKSLFTIALLAFSIFTNAQIKYRSNGMLTIGETEPYLFYQTTLNGSGMYFKCKGSNFFQVDVSPAATRLASHYDQVIFYNTQTNAYNSIQVKNVYNYSDARAKVGILPLKVGLATLKRFNPVNYNFIKTKAELDSKFVTGGDGKEIGLLAQEVEAILPNVVLTDPDGNKLINYTAIIPVLIQAVKELSIEVEKLKLSK